MGFKTGNQMHLVAIGWGVFTVLGVGSFVLAKRSVDQERLNTLRRKAAEKKEKKAKQLEANS